LTLPLPLIRGAARAAHGVYASASRKHYDSRVGEAGFHQVTLRYRQEELALFTS